MALGRLAGAASGLGIGALVFVTSVATLGGTLYRPTPEGPPQFVFFRNLLAHVKSACTKPWLWISPPLWTCNAVLMVSTGGAVGYAAGCLAAACSASALEAAALHASEPT
jgi:hypothetical protein